MFGMQLAMSREVIEWTRIVERQILKVIDMCKVYVLFTSSLRIGKFAIDFHLH